MAEHPEQPGEPEPTDATHMRLPRAFTVQVECAVHGTGPESGKGVRGSVSITDLGHGRTLLELGEWASCTECPDDRYLRVVVKPEPEWDAWISRAKLGEAIIDKMRRESGQDGRQG